MSESADEDENAWVLDALVGFLKGPIWNHPISSFIEQKSVVFETEDEDEQGFLNPQPENEREYAKIFDEYKTLVDNLLAAHMEDLGISPEQFDKACAQAAGQLTRRLHKALFEQIWAANDYTIFKRMMIQRNLDLQLQALEILARKYGLVPEVFTFSDPDQQQPMDGENEHEVDADGRPRIPIPQDYLKDDEEILQKVIQKSLEEEKEEAAERAYLASLAGPAATEPKAPLEASNSTQDDEKIYGAKDIAESMGGQTWRGNRELSIDDPKQSIEDERERLAREREKGRKLMETAIKRVAFADQFNEGTPTNERPPSSGSKSSLVKSEAGETGSGSERGSRKGSGAPSIAEEEFDISREELLLKSNAIPAEEVKRRQEYLRKQRDKLIAAKKAEREKQIKKLEEEERLAMRPASSHAIRNAMNPTASDSSSGGADQEKALQYRRSLAARLKAEVVENEMNK